MQNSRVSLHVSVARQELTVRENGVPTRSYPVSTSARGIGSEEGSMKTPAGRFRIAEKIGDGMPIGTVFRSRAPVPPEEVAALDDDDLILTRILWLDGLDADNANTFDRYIYIHGTNHEEKIGGPASHGCIRMRGRDIVELFDLVEVGTPVEIVP